MKIKLTVNGEPREADVWGGESLLFTLREQLELPGSKNACEQGECGSCSVLLDGTLVCSCLVLAAQADGHDVVTVEGVAEDGALHRVQEAFLAAGAVQCGFCTPGLIVATVDLLDHTPSPTDDQIREALSGNLCRCTGYQKIFDAVRAAARGMTSTSTTTPPRRRPGSSSATSASPSAGRTARPRCRASSRTRATSTRRECCGGTRSAARMPTPASSRSTSRRR